MIYKFWISILKEFRLLIRDKVGLAVMFLMPIILVLVITSIQNNTFEMVNNNQIALVVCNRDNGKISDELIESLKRMGAFKIILLDTSLNEQMINNALHKYDALVALVIPQQFSLQINHNIQINTNKALSNFGLMADTIKQSSIFLFDSITVFYSPVLQETYRHSINGALQSALLLVKNKWMVRSLYFSINKKEMPTQFENEMVQSSFGIKEKFASYNGSSSIPNATQHNIPAWTVFAMFFMVISLGGNIVKEKLSGSFIRLKVLPTCYLLGLISKQVIYLVVVFIQILVIFSMGVWLFPLINLPALNMPQNFLGVFIVSAVCGLCAISYALCIGVYAQTQEQSSGFGSVSIVILAAMGGVFVPSFAMPHAFQILMKCSPFYWSLQAYYSIFLENSKIRDIIINILPLLASILIFQAVAIIGLKRKNLI